MQNFDTILLCAELLNFNELRNAISYALIYTHDVFK